MLLNEKLTTELRPTLFLAQLSNLLAGNISIVHKVTGSSRTFMGEEGAGVAAVETAAARIRSGQSTHALVGGAFQTEHPDMLLGYELGRLPAPRRRGSRCGSAQASEGGGVVTGSGAAFLVLESREHAESRGARDLCRARPRSSPAAPGARASELDAEHRRAARAGGGCPTARPLLAISGASGAHAATAAEQAALDASRRGGARLRRR